MRRYFKPIFWTLFGLIILLTIVYAAIQPSNDRAWTPDQEVLPYAYFEGDSVRIDNVRNFHYRSEFDYDVRYDNRTYNLNDLVSVDFIVVPFRESRAAAHTFVSFGFRDSSYVAISIEIRKEQGESYSVTKGLLKRYEIMYVIGDENDLIKLRTNYRLDDVYLYPIDTPREKVRQMFVAMLQRANKLHDDPEFYNSFTNNCTSNLIEHVNTIAPDQVPFSFKALAPGYADELAYELDMIDTDLPWANVRPHFYISDKARAWGDKPGFSLAIRQFE